MKNFKILRVIITLFVPVLLIITCHVPSFASTGAYFGSDTTENGSVIWGGTEDVNTIFTKIYTVHPAETHNPGTFYTSATGGFIWPYPENTLRYSLVKDSPSNEGRSNETYVCGTNEKNVTISIAISVGSSNLEFLTWDPLMWPLNRYKRRPHIYIFREPLTEADLGTLILMQAHTARQAVELVGNIINAQGAADRTSFMVSDPSETWYMEVLSGQQYVAVKTPSSKIAIYPGQVMIGAVDTADSANVISSPWLIPTADSAGTLKTDAQGRILVAESYTDPLPVKARLYQGIYYLKGALAAKNLIPGYQPAFIDPAPGKKYSLYEIMSLFSFHGNKANTTDSMYIDNPLGNSFAIGNASTLEAHVFERKANMPADISTITWLAMGPPEFSLYLPYYNNLISETHESYLNDSTDGNSFYRVFREIYNLSAKNRAYAETEVKDFLENYQKALINQQAQVDVNMNILYAQNPELAKTKATEIGKAMAGEALGYAKTLLAELRAFDALEVKGAFSLSADLKASRPTYALELPASEIPEISDQIGTFTISADKANKTVTISGEGYSPSKSVPVMLAYNREPSSSDNDFAGAVITDTQGNFEFTVPTNVTESARWLGGEFCCASVCGVIDQAPIYATKVKINSGVRVNAGIRKTLQLSFEIDGVAYEFTSSNNNVATISQSGLITTLKAGTSVITLRATDGSGLIAAITLNVST